MKLTILILFLLILTGCTQAQTITLDSFTLCLTEKGAKMYGTQWCSHCQKQKELFKESFKNIDYTDCDAKNLQCKTAGVNGYPTWIFSNGSKLPGTQSLKRLSDKTGCPPPS